MIRNKQLTNLGFSGGTLGLVFLVVFSSFCLYIVSYVSSLQEEVTGLRSDLELKASIEKSKLLKFEPIHSVKIPTNIEEFENVTNQKLLEKIQELELRLIRLYEIVDPWERCLRFKWHPNCEFGGKRNTGLPCSTAILKEMIFAVTEVLEKHAVTHWISYGTLLGAVRNHSIIPWTYDVDVVIPGSEFKEVEKKIRLELLDQGYYLFYDKKVPDIGRVCIIDIPKYNKLAITSRDVRPYYNNYPYVDLYQTDIKYSKVVVKHGPLCKFDPEIVFPPTKVKLYDRELYAPRNSTAYLTQLYGDFMEIPPKDKRTGHGAYSEACKDG